MSSPLDVMRSALRHKDLVLALAGRDVAGRYRGSALGNLWSLVTPLVMLAVYTFVFGFVYQARWHAGELSTLEFSVAMFSGLIVHGFFAEVTNRAPTLVTQNVNFVKKVVFPLEILPWVAVSAAGFHFLVSFGVLLVGTVALTGSLHWTLLLAPLVLLPLILVALGVAWMLASFGVFLRDLPQLVPIAVTVLLFLSPVFYPLSAVHGTLRWIVLANPLTLIIENFRGVVLWGTVPDAVPLIGYFVIAWMFAWGALAWFQKTRRGFADVI